MDYKYLSIALVIILILVVAFFAAREFVFKKGEGEKPQDNTKGDKATPKDSGGLGDVFEEPPKDFKPPSLPP